MASTTSSMDYQYLGLVVGFVFLALATYRGSESILHMFQMLRRRRH